MTSLYNYVNRSHVKSKFVPSNQEHSSRNIVELKFNDPQKTKMEFSSNEILKQLISTKSPKLETIKLQESPDLLSSIKLESKPSGESFTRKRTTDYSTQTQEINETEDDHTNTLRYPFKTPKLQNHKSNTTDSGYHNHLIEIEESAEEESLNSKQVSAQNSKVRRASNNLVAQRSAEHVTSDHPQISYNSKNIQKPKIKFVAQPGRITSSAQIYNGGDYYKHKSSRIFDMQPEEYDRLSVSQKSSQFQSEKDFQISQPKKSRMEQFKEWIPFLKKDETKTYVTLPSSQNLRVQHKNLRESVVQNERNAEGREKRSLDLWALSLKHENDWQNQTAPILNDSNRQNNSIKSPKIIKTNTLNTETNYKFLNQKNNHQPTTPIKNGFYESLPIFEPNPKRITDQIQIPSEKESQVKNTNSSHFFELQQALEGLKSEIASGHVDPSKLAQFEMLFKKHQQELEKIPKLEVDMVEIKSLVADIKNSKRLPVNSYSQNDWQYLFKDQIDYNPKYQEYRPRIEVLPIVSRNSLGRSEDVKVTVHPITDQANPDQWFKASQTPPQTVIHQFTDYSSRISGMTIDQQPISKFLKNQTGDGQPLSLCPVPVQTDSVPRNPERANKKEQLNWFMVNPTECNSLTEQKIMMPNYSLIEPSKKTTGVLAKQDNFFGF